MLDQPVRTGVRLANLARGAIGAQEPVVAQGSRVFLLRDPDALGCLLLETLEAARRTVMCALTSR